MPNAKRRPARPCQIIDQVPGPHPGCAEFAPPEVIVCRNPATHVIKVPGRDAGSYEATLPFKLRVCEFHSHDDGTDPGARVYRFRRL